MVHGDLTGRRLTPAPRLAWRPALRWTCWIAVAYAAPFVAGRAVVTYRFGGDFAAPYLWTLLGLSAGFAMLHWPVLAVAARRPATAAMVRSALQWAAVSALTVYLVLALGALWDDETLALVAKYVAPDLAGAR